MKPIYIGTCLATGLMASLAAVGPAAAQSPEALGILSTAHRGLTFEIQMQGPVERDVAGESTEGLTTWTPTGTTGEFLRGFYVFVDPDAGEFAARYYRMQDNGPVVPGAWADNYAVTPRNGEKAGIVPRFEWTPYPLAPPIEYELNVYEFERAPGGRLILPSAPVLTVAGLTGTSYDWDAEDRDLTPTSLYGYTVTANLLNFGVQDAGNINFFVPFGGTSAVQPTDWAKLMEVLKAMQDELARLKSELGNNPLIAEIQLIERLIQIIGNYDLLQQYLISVLNAEYQKLIDSALTIETLKQILCFLEDAAEILALDHADGSSAKNALTALKNSAKAIKERIEAGEDLAQVWNDFQSMVNDLRAAITNPVGFILDAAKDAFKKKLRDILVRKFGEAAAGSLMTIAINLAVFADALITLNSIDTLELEINRLLKEAIANSASRDVFNPDGTFVFPLQPGQEDCDITIAFKKICFNPTPATNDSPDAGDWGPAADVPFAGPPTAASKTKKGGDYQTTFAFGINDPYKFCSDPKVPVPCTEGPCLIYVEVTIKCDGRPARKHRIFAGVVKSCP